MPNPMNHRYYYVMMGDFIINVLDNCHQSRRPRVTGQDSNKSDSNDTISCDSVPNASVSVLSEIISAEVFKWPINALV
ncbi:hypothetical protein J6590_016209 [Homalodisca vitripennis]|nr:hypothetical protein J6590_016209 [Homalodisca vitripennis]